MTPKRSFRVAKVPLYLIPQIVTGQIRKTGDILYRITVIRTNLHHFNITVRTKTFRKELEPVEIAVGAPTGQLRRTRAGCAP
jgi:hypothetical protein